jgi:transposase-like protein
MVDSESQSVLKMRSLSWSQEPFTALTGRREALVRNGHAPNGKQLYRCRSCGRQSRENPTPHAYPSARREEILHAYQERSSLHGLTRTFGVSRTTVSSWIKKRSSASPFVCNAARPGARGSHFYDAGAGRTDGSFVLKKANDSWMWMALCRKSRQVVAYTVGDRSRQDVPAVVGGHCRGISPRALLNLLLGGLRGGDPQGAAYRRGQRDGRNRPCRAVE